VDYASPDLLEWMDIFGDGACPIDRLAAALFVNCPHPGGRMMATFSAYFDASGNSADQPYEIVTGYLANYIQWKLLEDQWKVIHAEYGIVQPFHMTHFVAALKDVNRYATRQKKPRADYIKIAQAPDRAKECLSRLTVAQLGMVHCGISCIVPMRIYDEIEALIDLRKNIPPYALGARMCIARIHKWEAEFDIPYPVECIFESGDFGQGEFTKIMIDEGMEPPIYKNKIDYAGLQAADHYAWEQAYFLKNQIKGQHLPATVPLLLQLNLIPKLHAEVTRENLLGLCAAKGIRAKSWNHK
jgi:hypothetical protein